MKTGKQISCAPNHIAFIMDGNGRWAEKRGLPRSAGHTEGAKRIKDVATVCKKFGVKIVSLYAFSTENWKRPKEEIDFIFDKVREHFDDVHYFVENDVKVVTMGDITKFPSDLQDCLKNAKEKTKNCKSITLNIGANYGGREEIAMAVNSIIKAKLKKVDASTISEHLYTKDLPDPDLIVRTSGEQRLSGFMLYQCAYSELFFAKFHWPDMKEKNVAKCIKEYSKRNRRFGGLK